MQDDIVRIRSIPFEIGFDCDPTKPSGRAAFQQFENRMSVEMFR